ncbi:MAG: very short patch repair endonuclease [Arhodomonas sp.]|nr:very short patch repair endonuclease [Arhodomonas sp.]
MVETTASRSRVMRTIKSENTTPELIVRRITHRNGYRYRLHRKDLPGRPDLAFPGRRKVIFVHGCFWHGHNCRRGARIPKSNTHYWKNKIYQNIKRDRQAVKLLEDDGWMTLVLWECELKDQETLAVIIDDFLRDYAS